MNSFSIHHSFLIKQKSIWFSTWKPYEMIVYLSNNSVEDRFQIESNCFPRVIELKSKQPEWDSTVGIKYESIINS